MGKNQSYSVSADERPDQLVSGGPARPGSAREIFAWAMFDFANLGSYTVVLTTIFNCYFVNVVAGAASGLPKGTATLLWTIAIAFSNLLVVVTAPILGAIADLSGTKKRLLLASAICFAAPCLLLAWTGPGQVLLALILVALCDFMSWTGFNLAAAFLPGRIDR